MFKKLLKRFIMSLGQHFGPDDIRRVKAWFQKLEVRAHQKAKEVEERVLPPDPEVGNPDDPVTLGTLKKIVHSSEARETKMAWIIAAAVGGILMALGLMEEGMEERSKKKAEAASKPATAKVIGTSPLPAPTVAAPTPAESKRVWHDKLNTRSILAAGIVILIGMALEKPEVIKAIRDLIKTIGDQIKTFGPEQALGLGLLLLIITACWIFIHRYHRNAGKSSAVASEHSEKKHFGFPKLTWPAAVVLVVGMVIISPHLPQSDDKRVVVVRDSDTHTDVISISDDYGPAVVIRDKAGYICVTNPPNVPLKKMLNYGEWGQREFVCGSKEDLADKRSDQPVRTVRYKTLYGDSCKARVIQGLPPKGNAL